VTSDYQAMHSTVPSADAGTDQEMPAPQFYRPALQAAVQDGQVRISTGPTPAGTSQSSCFRQWGADCEELARQ
jgi:hypothetical protein